MGTQYPLLENYRSKSNLVAFANQWAQHIGHRLKNNPSLAVQSDPGTLKIVRYHSEHLIVPFVQDICTNTPHGSTAILTKTNEEALQIAGMLLKHGIPAKCLQTQVAFNLYNLLEIRCFIRQLQLVEDVFTISDAAWAWAKHHLNTSFGHSSYLPLCRNLIKDFEAIHPKTKYKSELETFIRESKPEDFVHKNGKTLLVSTIHKAKGKEFDTVFLLLQNGYPTTDAAKRQLYVGITRAKKQLAIHLNTALFDSLHAAPLQRVENTTTYAPPNELILHLGYKEVWLDYFIPRQHLLAPLVSGAPLTVSAAKDLHANGQCILKFSKYFQKRLQTLEEKNYTLKTAKINLILYWPKKESAPQDIKIILPELYFEKKI